MRLQGRRSVSVKCIWEIPVDKCTWSDGGITWTPRQNVESEADESMYLAMFGSGPDPQITGKQSYVYYTHSRKGKWNRWDDLELLRRRITLEIKK